MTPQEKAYELVSKFTAYANANNGDMNLLAAKQCAIIAVDEMLYACSVIDDITQPYTEIDEPTWTTFWQSVKTEINKL